MRVQFDMKTEGEIEILRRVKCRWCAVQKMGWKLGWKNQPELNMNENVTLNEFCFRVIQI